MLRSRSRRISPRHARWAFERPSRAPNALSELIRIREATTAPVECVPPPSVETVNADGCGVRVRVHEPMGRAATGALLEIHTGGFYLGSAAGSDIRNRRLVDALGVAIVSVDYRLAPEYPWPAAPDDCETAALWLAENAETHFGTSRLSVTGFSAGSTLATATLGSSPE